MTPDEIILQDSLESLAFWQARCQEAGMWLHLHTREMTIVATEIVVND